MFEDESCTAGPSGPAIAGSVVGAVVGAVLLLVGGIVLGKRIERRESARNDRFPMTRAR